MQYRKEIDGLRAVAVLPVVLFHAGVRGFDGGFLGVDVFFVISGFLIGGIIREEISDSRFSVARFYVRRARRLLPALVAVILVAHIMGAFLMAPDEFARLGASAAAASAFVSNIWFWQKTDYFSNAAEFAPLLHTWSLAVEEQFYIVAPLLLLAIARMPPRIAAALIWFGIFSSMAASAVLQTRAPIAGFYLLPSRAWELGVGLALAYGLAPRPPVRPIHAELWALCGLMAIACSVLLIGEETGWGNLAAVPSVLGAACFIWAGSSVATRVGATVAARPLVWVGLISYSLYLWHWVVLAFLRIRLNRIDLEPLEITLAVAASMLLAWVSWRYVEQPFRRSTGHLRNMDYRTLAFAGTVLLFLFSVSAAVSVGEGFPNRFAANARTALVAKKDYWNVDGACNESHVDFQACRFSRSYPGFVDVGVSQDSPKVLLWGDSHARAISPAVANWLRNRGVDAAFAFKNGCPPLLGVERTDQPDRDCEGFNRDVVNELIEHRSIQTVILHARWALAESGERPAAEGNAPYRIESTARDGRSMIETQSIVFSRAIVETVHALTDESFDVVLILGLPEIGWRVPNALTRLRLFDEPLPEIPDLASVRDRNSQVRRIAQSLVPATNVFLIDLVPRLCQPVCVVEYDGAPAYADDDHLSFTFANSYLSVALEAVAAEELPEEMFNPHSSPRL